MLTVHVMEPNHVKPRYAQRFLASTIIVCDVCSVNDFACFVAVFCICICGMLDTPSVYFNANLQFQFLSCCNIFSGTFGLHQLQTTTTTATAPTAITVYKQWRVPMHNTFVLVLGNMLAKTTSSKTCGKKDSQTERRLMSALVTS